MQVVDEEGNADAALMPKLDKEMIKRMYRLMVLTRVLDEKLFKLQRSGKAGTVAQVKGQEAQIGSALALEKNDWVTPSFRELGIYLARGVDPVKMVQAVRGDVRCAEEKVPSRNLPMCIPIATQCIYATGIAWAAKLKGDKDVVVAYFGDGATSEGDFHEGMNFAARYKAPVIFFCQNNQWAISTPCAIQTASDTLAQKAIAYGMPGIQIDGNDIIGVYKATKDAVDRARKGEGPAFIEAVTYRLGDHTTSDDASKYRSEKDSLPWLKKDPIERLKKYMQKNKLWPEGFDQKIAEEVEQVVKDAVEKALAIPPPGPEELFKHIYVNMIPELKKQQQQLIEEVRGE